MSRFKSVLLGAVIALIISVASPNQGWHRWLAVNCIPLLLN